MAKIKVVLDTNVLVGKDRLALLGAAGLGIYELILSPYILEEVEHVLVDKFRTPADRAAAYISVLNEHATIVEEAIIAGGNYDEWLDDPDDHPVMATAIAGEADYLVTANTKDFPPKKIFAGTTLITPEAFAKRMKIDFAKL